MTQMMDEGSKINVVGPIQEVQFEFKKHELEGKALFFSKRVCAYTWINTLIILTIFYIITHWKIEKQDYNPHGLEGLHEHTKIKMNYPTVGIPHPFETFNFTKVEKKDLILFDKKIHQMFKPYNNTDCEYTRIGRENDGGYVVCANHLKNVEYLINFGIRDDDVFGCDLSTLLKVPNYQYDCTTNIPQQCLTNNNLNQFEMICGGEITQKTPIYTFTSLQDVIKKKKMEGKHIFLKIDIEGGQYEVFRYFPMELLDNIDQIAMEVHFDSIYPELWGNLDMFKSLLDKFISVNYHINNNACFERIEPKIMKYRAMPALAFQVTLVNKKLITVHSQTRSFKQHSLNTPNNPLIADCQVKES